MRAFDMKVMKETDGGAGRARRRDKFPTPAEDGSPRAGGRRPRLHRAGRRLRAAPSSSWTKLMPHKTFTTLVQPASLGGNEGPGRLGRSTPPALVRRSRYG